MTRFFSLFSYPEYDWRYRCQFYPSQTQCTTTLPAVHCNRSRSALHPPLQCTASLPGMHRGVLSSAAVSSRMRGGRREHQEEK